MKIVVNVIRIITGTLFIFSGVVKAIDPKGLAYKMEEFFEAWAAGGFMPSVMSKLEHYSLLFSITMITLEVAVGVALLAGFRSRLTSWILVLLMAFFTFLTSYVLFTGKIKACGCFGDCIPLTPKQTFSKDILLLFFSILLLLLHRRILPVFRKSISALIVIAGIILTLLLQWYVLRNLPLVDCLPYKPGNNILELRKMPANAVADKFDYLFVYENNGVKKEFKADNTPDSPWVFVDRKQVLVQAGSNNIPLINDYSLTTQNGNDTTDDILNQKGEFYLLYIKDLDRYPVKSGGDKALIKRAVKNNRKLFVVSSQPSKISDYLFSGTEPAPPVPVFSCDATVIKTIARVNPTLYLMNGPVVKQKWSWTSFEKLEK